MTRHPASASCPDEPGREQEEMLTQFLTDIGAASLSPAVDLPANAEVKSPFAALHDRLTEEIASINVSLPLGEQ